MPDSLLAPSFLFNYAIPIARKSPIWTPAGAGLGEEHRLPALSQLDERPQFAEVRAAWHEQGLAFWCRVEGKRQAPWCRETRADESDGLRLWIDTRNTRDIHRASRFCHQFIVMPSGTGRGLDEPVAEQLLINRARENAKPVRPGTLAVRREKRPDGYIVETTIPAAALTGFDPAEHPRLGFMYAVIDRELGAQTFACPTEMPYHEDPSLWVTLELTSD